MIRDGEGRAERAVERPAVIDAGLVFIDRIRTPWTSRMNCPRQGRPDGLAYQIEIFEPWHGALEGISDFARLEILYWLHRSRHDPVLHCPRNDRVMRGTFTLRSPVGPNPIATSIVHLVGIGRVVLLVCGVDCPDGTQLPDIKPDRTLFAPLARAARRDPDIGNS